MLSYYYWNNHFLDAIKGILKYSPDEISILRRKIVTREVLFSYLDKKNIPVKLPTTKNDLIDQVIKFWNIAHNKDQSQAVSNQFPQGSDKAEEQVNSISLLAEQFTKWFYSLMNSDEVIGPEHFYQDAKLTLNLYSNGDCDTTILENNPEEIVQALFQLKLQNDLFFNPNISKDGTQGKMDPHGLVIVLVCGTVHVQQVCAGIFEQVFALARDPFCDNNWKIKHSELNLRSKNDVVGPPRLSDSGLSSNLLMLPSS